LELRLFKTSCGLLAAWERPEGAYLLVHGLAALFACI
jgi:hypothetical protein